MVSQTPMGMSSYDGSTGAAVVGGAVVDGAVAGVVVTAEVGAAALVEGGAGAFNVPLAERLAATGLRRLLLACGQRSCARDARRSLPWMKQGGLEVRFEDAPGAGHTWEGAVGAEVDAAVPWLLADDPRWQIGGRGSAP